MSAITKIFGTHSERELKRIYPLVDKVESYREAMGALSDEELKNKTKEYKERLENGETLDDLLPEAYATVREAAKRVLGMEHYRVQIIGGIILHQGRIAEMKTCLLYTSYLDMTREIIEHQMNGEYDQSIDTFRDLSDLVLELADYLARGLLAR